MSTREPVLWEVHLLQPYQLDRVLPPKRVLQGRDEEAHRAELAELPVFLERERTVEVHR